MFQSLRGADWNGLSPNITLNLSLASNRLYNKMLQWSNLILTNLILIKDQWSTFDRMAASSQRTHPGQIPDVFMPSISQIAWRSLNRWTEVHSTYQTHFVMNIFVGQLTHNRDRHRSATGQSYGALKAPYLSSITIFGSSRMGNKGTNSDYTCNHRTMI